MPEYYNAKSLMDTKRYLTLQKTKSPTHLSCFLLMNNLSLLSFTEILFTRIKQLLYLAMQYSRIMCHYHIYY